MSFLDGLQPSDKLLLFGGAALVAVIVIDKALNREEERPTRQTARLKTERRDEKRQAIEERQQREIDRAIEKAEDRLHRLNDRSADIDDRADFWRKRLRSTTKRTAVSTALANVERLEHQLERIGADSERLEERIDALRRGDATARRLAHLRNPDLFGTSSPLPKGELGKAMALSTEIHGTDGEVLELSARERQPLPRYVTVLGELPELSYEPDEHSKRAGYIYDHETGDRGPFAPKASGKAYVAINPRNRRPVLVFNSPTRLKAGQLNG